MVPRLALLLLACLASCSAVRLERQVDIDRPAADTWAVLADGERVGQWLEGLDELPWLDEQGLAVGQVRDVCIEEDGQSIEFQQTITELDPGHAFGFQLDYGWARFDSRLIVEATGDGTSRVVWDIELEAVGLVHAWVMNAVQGAFRKRFDQHLDALRGLVEQTG